MISIRKRRARLQTSISTVCNLPQIPTPQPLQCFLSTATDTGICVIIIWFSFFIIFTLIVCDLCNLCLFCHQKEKKAFLLSSFCNICLPPSPAHHYYFLNHLCAKVTNSLLLYLHLTCSGQVQAFVLMILCSPSLILLYFVIHVLHWTLATWGIGHNISIM